MGLQCFQSILPIVSKLGYQAFLFLYFGHKDERMPNKLYFQTKFFVTFKISHQHTPNGNSPAMLLKDTCFFPLKCASNSQFIIALNMNLLPSLSLCIPGRSSFQQAVGKWKGIPLLQCNGKRGSLHL